MTQRSRWAFSRLARVVAAGTAVVLFGSGSLLAQGTTGKIEGTVKDQSDAPIVGAQVLIVGSAYTTTTNEQGYYFLNNVPAGVITVRGQYIGYAPAEVRNVRVFAGQTMTVNLKLEQRAIEVTGITVTVEQNPIVPRDQVTSKPIVQGDVIQSLPVDAVSQVLRLQPGVVEGTRGLSIRGSRPGEQATYIDGVLVRNNTGSFHNFASGLSTAVGGTATVGTNALEEASVTTGAVGAEFGEAEGGVVSLVTRAGGEQFHGSLSYATDNVSGQVYGTGLNRVEASLGGPIAKNLTFFLGTTLQGQQNGLRPKGQDTVPYFVFNGYVDSVMVPRDPGNALSDSQLVRIPSFRQYASGCSYSPATTDSTGTHLSAAEKGTCNSTRLFRANSDAYTFDGKVQYTYGQGSRASVTYHRTRNQGLDGTPLFDPVAQTGNRQIGNALILSWNQNLTRSSEHALSFDANLSWQRDQYVAGVVLPSWMQDHTNPFGFFTASDIQFVTDFKTFPVDDALIRNLRLGNCTTPRAGGAGACTTYLNRNDLDLAGTYRFNPYGTTAGVFANSGINSAGPNMTQETRLVGRANIDWQANRYNRVRAGFDFTNYDELAWGSGQTNLSFMDAYKVSPKRSGMYASDRIDLGDVVIELGLRYDNLASNVMYPRAPARTFTDPFRSAALTLDQKLAQSYTARDSSMARACDAALTALSASATGADSTAANESLSTCNMFKADPIHILSPSLRVSFPVTDRTGFRLSYSHQVQSPDMGLLAKASNTDLSNSNTNDFFGRPLGFGRTIMFEFGIRHAFSDDMVLDVSAYNKDLVSEVTGRTLPVWDPYVGGNPDSTNENLNLLTNQDFGNIRGVDIRLDRRFGSIFQGTISYTYQTAKSTGSDPFEYLQTAARQNSAVTGLRLPPPQAILTTKDDRTHTIAGNVAANFPNGWQSGTLLGSILQNAGIFATFRFASGLPYTLVQNLGGGTRGPGNGFGLSGVALRSLNSSRMPWIKNVDLRITRGFRFGGQDLSVFADFRNLFNWSNLNQIFAETGDVVNTLYREKQISTPLATLKTDAGSLWGTDAAGVEGVDLSNCSLYKYSAGGQRGTPDCLMLRQAEARWGNGDRFFDVNEQRTAFIANYDRTQGPQSFNGPGFNLRLGFEFNF